MVSAHCQCVTHRKQAFQFNIVSGACARSPPGPFAADATDDGLPDAAAQLQLLWQPVWQAAAAAAAETPWRRREKRAY